MIKKVIESKPLVSIIIPVYNVQKYLVKCLDSLLLQTYKNIEIILVDDGSLDNSSSVCKQYVAKDSRIYFIMQENVGVTAARLNGFLHSHGKFIMFVDADDYVSPQIVELMLRCQQKYQADMVSCQYYDVKDERVIPASIRPALGYYDKKKIQQLLAKNFLYDKSTRLAGMSGFLCSKLFKRCFVQDALEVGKGIIHCEDQIAIFEMLYSINSMFVMQKPLYYYVVRKGQATRSYNVAYWRNFELFFSKLQEIDQANYLKKQLPNRVVMTLTSLIKMEFINDKISIFQRYLSVKKNFSNLLRSMGKNANTSEMGWKVRLQYYLIMHRAFLLYGVFIFLNGILKNMYKKHRK